MSLIGRMGPWFAGSVSPILDTYSGAVAAYSVSRKLKTSATGAFRLIRSSDSAEQDFSMVNGAPDIAGAQAFIGSNSAGVRTLYDQAGTNHIGLVGSVGSAPVLISSGTLQAINGIPQIVFNATGVLASALNFGSNNSLSGNPSFTIFIVQRKTTNTGGCLMGWGDIATALNAVGLYDDGVTALLAFAASNSYITTVPVNNTQYLTTVIKTPGAINTTTQVYRNGVSVGTTGHSTNTPNIGGGQVLLVGQWANYSAANKFIGGVQELIIFAGDKSSDRAAIEANIRAHYGF